MQSEPDLSRVTQESIPLKSTQDAIQSPVHISRFVDLFFNPLGKLITDNMYFVSILHASHQITVAFPESGSILIKLQYINSM